MQSKSRWFLKEMYISFLQNMHFLIVNDLIFLCINEVPVGLDYIKISFKTICNFSRLRISVLNPDLTFWNYRLLTTIKIIHKYSVFKCKFDILGGWASDFIWTWQVVGRITWTGIFWELCQGKHQCQGKWQFLIRGPRYYLAMYVLIWLNSQVD